MLFFLCFVFFSFALGDELLWTTPYPDEFGNTIFPNAHHIDIVINGSLAQDMLDYISNTRFDWPKPDPKNPCMVPKRDHAVGSTSGGNLDFYHNRRIPNGIEIEIISLFETSTVSENYSGVRAVMASQVLSKKFSTAKHAIAWFNCNSMATERYRAAIVVKLGVGDSFELFVIDSEISSQYEPLLTVMKDCNATQAVICSTSNLRAPTKKYCMKQARKSDNVRYISSLLFTELKFDKSDLSGNTFWEKYGFPSSAVVDRDDHKCDVKLWNGIESCSSACIQKKRLFTSAELIETLAQNKF